jgi:hypothetical protein
MYMNNNHAVRRVAIDLAGNSVQSKVVLPPTESNLKKLEKPQRRAG